ncbi:MAG: hypothetical protein H2049_08625 [Porphyrobacter sp.]|nr:hypothetical protein [Porphyrobacter sp.]
MRSTRTISFSLPEAVAASLSGAADEAGLSPGALAAEIVTDWLEQQALLPPDIMQDRKMKRELTEKAIAHMWDEVRAAPFTGDITLKTFEACMRDPDWMKAYAAYINDDAFASGNPRKADINRTIGRQIKAALGAENALASDGSEERGYPVNMIIRSYQQLANPTRLTP